MEAAIGVALTATMAGLTLASGADPRGGAVDGVTVLLDDDQSPGAQLAAAVRRIYVQGVRGGCRARWVAVTWTADADAHVAELSGLLAELDVELMPIPLASAGTALVSDSAYADTAICVLEPDAGRGLRGRAVFAGSDGPRAAIGSGLQGDDGVDWLADVLGELEHQPRRLVLVGADEHAHPVAAELSHGIRVDSETESILALALGAALAWGDAAPGTPAGPAAMSPGAKPVWLPSFLLAAMVLVSALVAVIPLGSAGPAPAPVPQMPVAPAVVAPPIQSPSPVAPKPVVTPLPETDDAPTVNQKQNQSDTSAALPEVRAVVPPQVVAPVVPTEPHVASSPDNCVVLCGFVL